MMQGIRRAGLALLLAVPLCALGWPAFAQQLPKPKEFYFDEDAQVARPIVVVNGSDDAAVAELARLMERNGRNVERVIAQLARISMASGRSDLGKPLYERALAATSERSTLRYAIAWNYGWDLYHAGEYEAALEQFRMAFADRVATPAWVPPTLAVVLWQLDRKDEAREWYAAAVRTEPLLWSDAGALAELLPDWRPADRDKLGEVLAAWLLDPPDWP